MFYFLNDAWLKTVIKQVKCGIIPRALVVTTNEDEYSHAIEAVKREHIWQRVRIAKEEEVRRCQEMNNMKTFGEILISPDLHDVMLKDFLAQHKRK